MSKKNKNKNKGGLAKTNVYELKDRIISILSRVPSNGINYKQLAKRLGIDGQAVRKELFSLLNELKSKGQIFEVQPGKYKAKEVHGYVTGIVDLTSMGYGYVVTDEMEDDVFISDKNLHTALNGDKVKVHLFAKKKGAKIEGEVLQIIERARDTFVGTIEILPNFAFLIPNNKNMPFDLFVPLSKLNGAKQGQKAIAKIVDWDPKSKNPVAEVVEV
ncbi:MAG: ribonuclease R, partial [Bacteroidales bacterium]|nr:ribonuclease R [Bacteroidales bacterium]